MEIMKKMTVVAAALLVVALATPSVAGIDEGDWEVQLGGNWLIGDFQSAFGVEMALGYFVTPEIQVGGWFGYTHEEWDGKVKFDGGGSSSFEITSKAFDLCAFAAYYFEMDGEWLPYVGGFVGWDRAELDLDGDDIDRDGFKIGAFVGIKYFVSEKATVFFEYRLTWRSEDEWEGDGVTVEENEFGHLFMVGLSVLF
jgi:opacity protein-like surface antigen